MRTACSTDNGTSKGGSAGLLHKVVRFAVLAGALGSLGLTLCAGRHGNSLRLLSLFIVWVPSPFLILAWANLLSKDWSRPAQSILYGVTLVLVVGSLAIYGNALSMPADSKVAAPFLVVPLASWLLAILAIIASKLISGGWPRFRLVRWLIKGAAIVGMFGVLGIAILLGSLWLDHNQDTTLPAPTGPFAVGRTTYVWSDATHIDPMAPQPGTKKELFAWIWYPAAPSKPTQTADDYLPARWRTALDQQRGGLISKFLTRDLSRVRAHSLRDAEVSPRQRAYPVVLMRAGLAALTADYSSLAEDLASHGYVVVGFDAPYRSFITVFPDGRVIARAPQNNADLLSGPQVEQLTTKLARAWTSDMSFALDQLERMNASDPSGRFPGRLDMQRIGVFGHSLGGATALQFCHDDSRCKAGIDVDGLPLGNVIADGISQPFMFIMSDHSKEPEAETRPVEANIRSIYGRLPVDRRWQIKIRGANHYMFSDGAMLRAPLVTRAMRSLGILPLDGRRQIALTAHYVSTFFDVYLNGASVGKLRNQPDNPEIEYIQ
ncbi:MAG TPA: hypothetical protein VN048_11630 [Verrucomicrobiae bacterium]|jgi:dienelactone hydrolase|nr:hypothetical protein [Verrucomicrobiae bacterium]